jgi:hypothetical protein
MTNLLGTLGVMLILAGITALIIGSVRHFFPFVDDYFPESFKQPLSVRYASYYMLAGALMLLLL